MFRIKNRHTIRIQKLDYSLPNKYFVTICCHHHGCYIGKYQKLFNIITSEIKNLNQKFPNISVINSAVMPNHVHLLISIHYQVSKTTLGEIIRVLKSRVVTKWLQEINKNKLNCLASIWQRNYYEHLIRNQEELIKFNQYITNNPKNWNNDRYNPTNFKATTVEAQLA